VAHGDAPEYTTEQLGRTFMQAFLLFIPVVRAAFDRYEEILSAHGFSYSPDS
jgi:hypothetical protein